MLDWWIPRRHVPAAVFLAMAVIAVLGASSFVEREAVAALSRGEARQVSQLVFQGIYALMRKGAARDDMEAAIAAMAATLPGMSIRVDRGEAMIRDTAAPAEEGETLSRKPLLERVAAGDEMFTTDEGDLRFLYPIQVREECPTCHTRARVGDIGGVVEVVYPLGPIKAVVGFVVNALIGVLAVTAGMFAIGLFVHGRLTGRRRGMVYRRAG
ncbi:MAG: hypothetical protein H7840_05890 [Alphaproteobacteria bacterium]